MQMVENEYHILLVCAALAFILLQAASRNRLINLLKDTGTNLIKPFIKIDLFSYGEKHYFLLSDSN